MIAVLIVAAIALWFIGIIWLAEYHRAKARIPQTRQKVYVSAGYWCDIEPAPDGADYDFIQKNHKIHHVAVTFMERKNEKK